MVEIHSLKTHDIPTIIGKILQKWVFTRKNYPLLPIYFKNPRELENLLRNIIQKYPAFGAYSNNLLISFILGYSEIPTFKGKEKGSFVPFWGFDWNPDESHIFIKLYQTIAAKWQKSGTLNHCISYFPDNLSLQNFLFKLGFGLLVIDAIRSLDPIPHSRINPKVKIRNVREEDLKEIRNLEKELRHTLTLSPTSLYSERYKEENSFKEYSSIKTKTFIIEKDNKIVAAMRGTMQKSNFEGANDKDTLGINFAFCHPDYRREGLSRALLNELLKWGREIHLKRCTVDFESANYSGRKFWSKYFKPISFNVIRKIDNRF